NDSERRCPRKREQAHTSGRGHEIDEPERKKRAEPQEQHVAERIGAEIMCKCLRTRADLAQEVLAKRASCNKKNADRPQGRAGDRSSASQKRAEQNTTDQCKKGADRQGERDKRRIKSHKGDHRSCQMAGDERAQHFVVARQRLERELPMPSRREDNKRNERNSAERRKPPQIRPLKFAGGSLLHVCG